MRKLWVALSQSPERRRRAKLAGKIKRTILELGGRKDIMEVEFATGTVWYDQVKICSTAAEKPRGAESAGAGWADIAALAKATCKPPGDVQKGVGAPQSGASMSRGPAADPQVSPHREGGTPSSTESRFVECGWALGATGAGAHPPLRGGRYAGGTASSFAARSHHR